MRSWNSITLGEALPFKYGKNLPASKRTHSGEYDVVSSAGIIDSHDTAFTTEPCIVIGRKGSIGSLTYCSDPVWPTDTTFYVTGTPYCDLRFGYYVLQTLPINQMNNDSAVPGLNRNDAESLAFSLPPVSEQKAIAKVLSSLDDKIAVNNRVISYSSSLNQLAVKQILAETEKTTTLGEEIILNYGKSLPVKSRIQGNVVVIGSGGIIGTHNEALLNTPAIIIGRKGTIGTIYWLDKPSFPIDTTFWVETKRLPLEFVFYLLKTIDFSGLNTDSAVPGLNRNHAYDIKIPSVADKQAKSVIERLQVFTRMISTLEQENQTLARTRDELLPLLMSGKITVRDAEEASAEVGVDKHEVEE